MKKPRQLIYNFESEKEFQIAARASGWAYSMLELDAWLRNEIRYNTKLKKAKRKVYEEMRKRIRKILEGHGLTLESLF